MLRMSAAWLTRHKEMAMSIAALQLPPTGQLMTQTTTSACGATFSKHVAHHVAAAHRKSSDGSTSGNDDDVLQGRIEMIAGHGGHMKLACPPPSPQDRSLAIMATVVPRESIDPEDPTGCIRVFAQRKILRLPASKACRLYLRKDGASTGGNVALRVVYGSTPEAYVEAAQKCAEKGMQLVLFSRTGSRLATYLGNSPSLAATYPQWFRSFRVDADVVNQNAEANERSRRRPRCGSVDVTIPIVVPKKPTEGTGTTLAAHKWLRNELFTNPAVPSSNVEPLVGAIVDAFFLRRVVHQVPAGSSDDGTAATSPRLEPRSRAFSRLRASCIAPYLRHGRKALPQPPTLTMLHRELRWDLFEAHLGSLSQALCEPEVLRLGSGMFLPLDEAYVRSTLLVWMSRFITKEETERQGAANNTNTPVKHHQRQPHGVDMVAFVQWMWRESNRSAAAIDKDKTLLLESDVERYAASFEAHRGNLYRYVLYFPDIFRVHVAPLPENWLVSAKVPLEEPV